MWYDFNAEICISCHFYYALKGDSMLDFDKELEKFQPSLEVEEVEDVVRHNDMSDVADLIKELLRETGEMR